jgi:hypothetical protein
MATSVTEILARLASAYSLTVAGDRALTVTVVRCFPAQPCAGHTAGKREPKGDSA